MDKYSRNTLYVNNDEQTKIAKTKVLLGGAGLGSNIAECMLRLGFTTMKIIDKDTVESSNLNRQNYTIADIGKSKVEALYNRLKAINPEANISYEIAYLDKFNIQSYISDFQPDIAINALDFTSDVPFIFDDYCIANNIPILHPFNFGWAGFAIVIKNQNLRFIQSNFENFELAFVDYILRSLKHEGQDCFWLEEKLNEYKRNPVEIPYSQLSVGSWITAGLSTSILFRIANNKPVNYFPNYYFLPSM